MAAQVTAARFDPNAFLPEMLPEISRQGCHRCEIGDRHRDRPPGIGAPAKVTVGGGREKESVKELASPATSAPSGRRPRVAPSRSVKAGTPGADAVGGPPERAVGSRADGGGLPAKGQGKPATGGASGAGAVDRCARALRCKFRPDPLGLAPPLLRLTAKSARRAESVQIPPPHASAVAVLDTSMGRGGLRPLALL